MKALLVPCLGLGLWLAACKDRGTVTVPLVQPCADVEPDAVAVYLERGSCATAPVACGLGGFECKQPDCIAGCDGHCTLAEVEAGLPIDPPRDGDYRLLLSYHYPGAATDHGLVCFDIHVDADGTQSRMIEHEESQACCGT